MSSTPLPIRLGLAAGIALTFFIIVARVLTYKPFMTASGAGALLVGTTLLLLFYTVTMVWPDSGTGPVLRSEFATKLGLIGGGLQAIDLLVEDLFQLPQRLSRVESTGLMLATLAIWCFAAYKARRQGATVGGSCLVAAWCAVVTTVISVFVSTLLGCFVVPWLHNAGLHHAVQHAAMQQGTRLKPVEDAMSVAISGTLWNAISTLLFGPALAELIGAIGCGVAYLKSLMGLSPGSENKPQG